MNFKRIITMVVMVALVATGTMAVNKAKKKTTSDFEKAVDYFNKDMTDGALPLFNKVVTEKPNGYDAPYAWAYIASIKLDEKDLDGASAAIAAAEGKIPASDTVFTAWTYGVKSRIMLAKEDTAQALAAISKAIELQPNDDFYYGSRGVIYHQMGKYAEAESDITKEVALATDGGVDALVRLNCVQDAQGNYEQALATAEKAIARDPKNASGYAYRASTLYNLGRYSEAMDDVIRAYEIDGEDEHCNWVLPYLATQDSAMVQSKLQAKALSDPANASKWQGYANKMKETIVNP